MRLLPEKNKHASRPGKSRRFVAVSQDGATLRIVQAEQSHGATRLLRLIEQPLPGDVDREDPAALGAFLGQTLRGLRLGGSTLLMCVPRGQAVLKSAALPAGTAEADFASMVQYQVQGELPFRAEEAVIDFTAAEHFSADAPPKPAEGAKDQPPAGTHLLVAAVRLPVADFHRRLVEAAGCRLDRLAIRSFANLCCVEACTVREAGESVAIVHVMPWETEIDVIAGNSLAFSRSAVVKIPTPVLMGAPETDEAVNSVTMEVIRSLQGYQTVQRGEKVAGVLVAGATGIEQKLVQTLATRLGVKCEMFSPRGALRLGDDRPLIVEEAGAMPTVVADGNGHRTSAFISAMGLALGYTCKDGLRLDFLNPKRPGPRRDTKKVVAVQVTMAVVLFLVGLFGARMLYIGAKEAGKRSLQATYSRLVKEQEKVKSLGKRVREIDEWGKGNQDWLDHLAFISSILPGARDVYVGGFVTNNDGAITIPLNAYTADVLEEARRRINESNCYELGAGAFDSTANAFGYIYSSDLTLTPRREAKIDLTAVKPPARPADDVSAEALLKRPGGGSGGSSSVAPEPTPIVSSGAASHPPATPVNSNPPPASPGSSAAPPAAAPLPGSTPYQGDIPVVPGRKFGPFADLSAMTDKEKVTWGARGKFDLTGRGDLTPEEEKMRADFRARMQKLRNNSDEWAAVMKRLGKDRDSGSSKRRASDYYAIETRLWQEECLAKGIGR